MTFQDRSLQCSDCRATFTFGVEEQEFFAFKGCINELKRCLSGKKIRELRKWL